MEFPFGHHNHHHHHTEQPEPYPPPQIYPPPPTHGGACPYPPPSTYPPPPFSGRDYPHAPPQPPHLAGNFEISQNTHQNHMNLPIYPPPQPPPYGSHHDFMHGHESNELGVNNNNNNGVNINMDKLGGYFVNKKSCKVKSKAGGNSFCVGIRDGKVVLTYDDPNDLTQHWYKDEKYSTKVKDEDGYPSFSLVSKATGEVMKHQVSGHPVELVPYNPDRMDPSILWTESKDLGFGFRTIRNVNNVHMVLDAFNGDKNHGGVHDGTFLSIFKCWKGDNQNQQWKISPC